MSDLYDCKRVRIVHGHASSATNNTRCAFELWWKNPGNIDDHTYVGTMAPYTSYDGLGTGDDDTNDVFSPGC
ncbi:hypothetical protein [Actinoplanes teichomyceticus]|uniref:hypothetical protein n=1 Tax=Actinoplanes teichomyceticus TaxID=1867 RepID=UPI0011A151B6|nr:hypothetical protein [Actinoplanes teichomyceticus]